MSKKRFDFGKVGRPGVYGVLNVTPDSFSDGGRYLDVGAAVLHAREMVRAGAVGIDVGAEASSFFREGVVETSAGEQLRRLLPVLEEVVKLGVVVSVDTRSAEVAGAALEMGADVINDISAGTHDAGMLEVVARGGAGMVLMHIGAGWPATPGVDEGDIVGKVRGWLRGRVEAAMGAGIGAGGLRWILGWGLGRRWGIIGGWLCGLGRFGEMEGGRVPVMLGVSRKRFLETEVPGEFLELRGRWAGLVGAVGVGGHVRDAATAVVTGIAVGGGAEFHRVHEVGVVAGRLGVG